MKTYWKYATNIKLTCLTQNSFQKLILHWFSFGNLDKIRLNLTARIIYYKILSSYWLHFVLLPVNPFMPKMKSLVRLPNVQFLPLKLKSPQISKRTWLDDLHTHILSNTGNNMQWNWQRRILILTTTTFTS